ncbi:MAG: hypothetical protein K8S98_04630 [Planctomycetes bacterium]|nr:hypothetical protein [Planctomycetota bacterium]
MSSIPKFRLRRVATWSGRAPRIPRELLTFGWLSVVLQLALAIFLTVQIVSESLAPSTGLAVAYLLISVVRDVRPLRLGRGRSRTTYVSVGWVLVCCGSVVFLTNAIEWIRYAADGSAAFSIRMWILVVSGAAFALGLRLVVFCRSTEARAYFTHYERRELRRKRLTKRFSRAAVAQT